MTRQVNILIHQAGALGLPVMVYIRLLQRAALVQNVLLCVACCSTIVCSRGGSSRHAKYLTN